MKFLLSVVVVAGSFALVLLGGGAAVGIWKELELPATSAAADDALRALAPARSGKAEPKARKKERRPPKEQLAKRGWGGAANRICRQAAREAGDVGGPRAPGTVAEAEKLLARVAELNARYNDRMRALPTPPGAGDRITRLVKLFDKEEAAVEELLEAVRDRDPARMNAVRDRLMGIADRQSLIMYNLGAFDCAL